MNSTLTMGNHLLFPKLPVFNKSSRTCQGFLPNISQAALSCCREEREPIDYEPRVCFSSELDPGLLHLGYSERPRLPRLVSACSSLLYFCDICLPGSIRTFISDFGTWPLVIRAAFQHLRRVSTLAGFSSSGF